VALHPSDGASSTPPVGFKKSLQITAAAILLLRRREELPKHWKPVVGEEPQPLLSSEPDGSPDASGHSADAPNSDRSSIWRVGFSQDGSSVRGSSLDIGNSMLVDQHLTSYPLRPQRLRHEVSIPAPYTNAESNEDSELDSNRDWYLEGIESQLEASLSTSSTEAESFAGSQVVSTGLGRRVLAQSELIVNIITFTSMIVIMVKLASVVMPPLISIPAWFMIVDWAAVQLLIAIVPHKKAVDDDDSARVRHVALSLESSFSVLTLFLLVLFVFVSHFLTFAMDLKMEFLPAAFGKVVRIVFINYIPIAAWVFFGHAFILTRRRDPGKELPAFMIIVSLSFVTLGLIGFSLGIVASDTFYKVPYPQCSRYEKDVREHGGIPLTHTCGSKLLLNYTLFLGPKLLSIWTMFLVPAIIEKKKSQARHFQLLIMIWNLVFTGFLFTGGMVFYDSSETYKPNWLDWLGKIKRWLGP